MVLAADSFQNGSFDSLLKVRILAISSKYSTAFDISSSGAYLTKFSNSSPVKESLNHT